MKKLKLDPFSCWMVKQNIKYAKDEGVENVVNRLKAQGYDNVAAAVEEQMKSIQKTTDINELKIAAFDLIAELNAETRDGFLFAKKAEEITEDLHHPDELVDAVMAVFTVQSLPFKTVVRAIVNAVNGQYPTVQRTNGSVPTTP